MPKKEICAAVITGAHSYNVIPFRELFASLTGVHAYVQHLDDFCSSSSAVRADYDVLVFFNFHQAIPDDASCEWWQGKQASVLSEVANGEQGIVFLHHGLLAYREWTPWSKLVGIEERGFGYAPDQEVVVVPNTQHPITEGLSPWTMVDEVYSLPEPDVDREVLLMTDHPKSMRSLAWATQNSNKRIFCMASGHDDRAWRNATFQQVLQRGMLWCADALV